MQIRMKRVTIEDPVDQKVTDRHIELRCAAALISQPKHVAFMYIVHCVTICPYSVDLVAGEIFIEYANEAFPFLLGRELRSYM